MRFDDLLLSEEEYASSASVSAQEWVLMYSKGVPPSVIARWCRVGVWRVSRAINQRAARDPGWWGRCLVVHDQPALPPPSRSRRVSREQAWTARYVELAAYVRTQGRFPSQTGDRRGRVLYAWLQGQRAHHRAGTLTQDRAQSLDQLGSWGGAPRGDLQDHWQRRLYEVEAFRGRWGRDPVYDPTSPGRRPEEKVLAVWVGYQRTLARKGRLRADRRERLDEVLPGWDRGVPG